MEKLWVYLDDVRPLPVHYDVLVRTAEEAIALIQSGVVEHISLDNDLGTGFTEGKKVAQWIEQEYITGNIKWVEFSPHTSNPVAWEEIMQCARNCYQHKLKTSKTS